VLDALERDPSKRFTYVEMAFFTRWFYRLPPARQDVVRTLVSQRRLVFANGGWCMHDEASSYYADAVDQSALGHQFIAAEFGINALPSVGWQIDPFGHSSLQASLLGPGLGLSAVFFGRADYADLERRQTDQQFEFRWMPDTPGADPGFFGMLFGTGNYGPPDGFNWDLSGDEPIDDDPNSTSYNAPRIVDGFVNVTLDWAKKFKGAGPGGDLMLLLGSDFEYQVSVHFFLHLLPSRADNLPTFASSPDRQTCGG
jgi:alpha-mannosidase